MIIARTDTVPVALTLPDHSDHLLELTLLVVKLRAEYQTLTAELSAKSAHRSIPYLG